MDLPYFSSISKCVGNGIGVPSGNGVIEQKLQHLMVGKAIQASAQKALAHLLAMPVMNAQQVPSPAAKAAHLAIFIRNILL